MELETINVTNNDDTMLNELKENKRYFILKVHEYLTRNSPIFIATVASNKNTAIKTFKLMRNKFPVIDPSKFVVIDSYDMDLQKDIDRLINSHGSRDEILFMINKTSIGTYVPIEFKKPICDLYFIKNKLCICNLVNTKDMKNINDIIDKTENIIQHNYLSTRTESMLYINQQQGDEIVINRLKAGDDIVFIIKDMTIDNIITFMKRIYKIAKDENVEDGKLKFIYHAEVLNSLYYIDIDDTFSLRHMDFEI